MSVHPSICSSACLFSSLSIHQPVHWFIVNPCLHLLTCPSTRPPAHPCTNHGPPACQSSHTCILITCPFTYPCAYSCTIGFSFSPSGYVPVIPYVHRLSISPVSVHLMSNLSVHCYYICLSDCLSIYH